MENEKLNGPTVVVSRNVAEHYVWGGRCDGWHLVKTDDLSVIEERMPPGTQEVRHHHQHSQQFFYVLAGELTMEVEHHNYALKTGEGLEIRPGQRHQAMNRGGVDVRMVVVSQPPSHGDRIDD